MKTKILAAVMLSSVAISNANAADAGGCKAVVSAAFDAYNVPVQERLARYPDAYAFCLAAGSRDNEMSPDAWQMGAASIIANGNYTEQGRGAMWAINFIQREAK